MESVWLESIGNLLINSVLFFICILCLYFLCIFACSSILSFLHCKSRYLDCEICIHIPSMRNFLS
nr:MAG TPA: hypothetical protein [Caudoviricetes sp.]